MERRRSFFTMDVSAADAVLIAVYQSGTRSTVTARLRDAEGVLLPLEAIEPTYNKCPMQALSEMLQAVSNEGAKNCGIFTNSETLLHWVLVERLQCRLTSAKETSTVHGNWQMKLPKPSVDPRWDILRILTGYTHVGIWKANRMPITERLHVDRWRNNC